MRSPRSAAIEDILLIAILIFAPLALASVHTWAYCTIALISLMIFDLHFLSNRHEATGPSTCHPERVRSEAKNPSHCHPERVRSEAKNPSHCHPERVRSEATKESRDLNPSSPRKRESLFQIFRMPISTGILLFILINLLYIIPLPATWIKFLSPETYNIREAYMLNPASWQPLSIYPHATILYLIKFTSYAMIFFVIVSKCQSVRVSEKDKGSSGVKSEGLFKSAPEAVSSLIPSERTKQSHSVIPSDPGALLRKAKQPGESRDLKKQNMTPKCQNPYLFLGALCSILAILFHSLCDFNMHIPANALYFTVILALVAGLSGSRHYRSRTFLPPSSRGANFPSPSLRGAEGDEAIPGNRHHSTINYAFINKLTNSIILIGFAIAVFGIIQKLSYNGKIYWMIQKPGGHFGPYINYDHYAGYMGMCVLLAVAQFLTKIARSSLPHIKKLKDKIVWFSSAEANKTLIYLFMAIVMTAALFITTSRGGIMSFAAALLVFYFVCVISASRRKRKRILLASFMAVLLITIMILWIGPEETVDKFKVLNRIVRYFIKEKAILSEIRPYMWQDTLALIRDFPVFGTGLGAYYSIFAKYRTFPDQYGFLRYAHNDYLQMISEMGAVGGLFILGFFVWYIRRFGECVKRLKAGK